MFFEKYKKYRRAVHFEIDDPWTMYKITTEHGHEVKREYINREKMFWEKMKWILEH